MKDNINSLSHSKWSHIVFAPKYRSMKEENFGIYYVDTVGKNENIIKKYI